MQEEIHISTSKNREIVDITSKVEEVVAKSKVKIGLCNVYTPHATAGIIINENYDPNVMDDILEALNNSIPEGKWRHDAVDNNGAAHIKAAILGPSETIPIKDGRLLLGQWQDVMLADFDGPRQNRKIIITVK